MNVFGTGLVCARGRGRDATTTDWQPPTFVDVPFQDKPFPVYAISAETLKDRAVLGKMRRADRFSKMAVLAAHDAMAAAEPLALPPVAPERIGIILGTALGPHVTTFKFLDDIIEYGDKGVSPTIFSNTVHNAAVSYISRSLGIRGPTWTLTSFKNPFGSVLDVAQAWLSEGRCDRVLMGAGDECGTVMDYICSRKLPIAEDGKVREGFHVPGEGMAFFLVDNQEGGRPLPLSRDTSDSLFGNTFTGRALHAAAQLLT